MLLLFFHLMELFPVKLESGFKYKICLRSDRLEICHPNFGNLLNKSSGTMCKKRIFDCSFITKVAPSRVRVEQFFSTFFGLRHPLGLKKSLAAPLIG